MMPNNRRSWLDRLLGRSQGGDVSKVAFQPAGTSYNGVIVPVPYAVLPGKQALELVLNLQRTAPEHHAFLLAEPDRLPNQFEAFDEMQPAKDTLQQAETLTIAGWRSARAAQLAKILEEHPDWGDLEEGPEHGPWPDEVDPQDGFLGPRDITTGEFLGEAIVGLSPAPVSRWWETAAHLRFGGWNDCPDSAVHVMLHRQWAEKYGARLVTMAFDVIELAIERPITTREEALEVASLQFEYCNDIVDQGMETLENLAASLIGAKTWYFWWD